LPCDFGEHPAGELDPQSWRSPGPKPHASKRMSPLLC